MPKVKELIDETEKLNYLLILETTLNNFTIGAWMKDAMMGIKHLTKWNRAAIVSDVEAIRNFTDFFSYLMLENLKDLSTKKYKKPLIGYQKKIKIKTKLNNYIKLF